MALRELTLFVLLVAACESDIEEASPAPGADAAPETSAAGGSGGSGGSPPFDAGIDSGGRGAGGSDAALPHDGAPSDGGCTTEYFADRDGDGFGGDSEPSRACAAPDGGWVTVAGDCDDTNPDVFPGQTRYFGAAYAGPRGESFDYDCSGAEDPDPDKAQPAPDCASLGVLECEGKGYTATRRTGDGVNPICGSERAIECAAGLLGCGSSLPVEAEPAGCR
jgi:hypothetical protein